MPDVVDKSSILPLYYQLKLILRDMVDSGSLKPGDAVPSEYELVNAYGVSRATARRALSDLTVEGLFHRIQGKGTFVSPTKILQGLSRFYAFTEDMSAKGYSTASRVLEMAEEVPAPGVRRALALDSEARVAKISRLRLVNGEPVILETTYVPTGICPGLVGKDLSAGSLYDAMAKGYGVTFAKAEEYFEPVLADGFEAELLGVRKGAPCLLLSRVAFDSVGRPVEHTKAVVRGDRCRYYVNLPRE